MAQTPIDKATLYEKLQQYFGFATFKGNQEAVIENLLSGRDTFVLMPTGGGKSLCYQLPALMMEGVAIIISPLIALMKNQVDAMCSVSATPGIAHFLNSSLNRQEIQTVKDDVLQGKTKLLYFAPESLTKEENILFLRKIKISFYAVDEAHCISEWGHDFRPEYRRIRPIINDIGDAPIITLTATATPKVQLDIQKNLSMSDAAVFRSSFNRPNLYYEIRPKTDPDKDIIRYIKTHPDWSGIIYCLSRKKVEELTELLVANSIKALSYHAGMEAQDRAKNQDDFLMDRANVIVATIAFGMGIDKPDVRFVIHYDIPKSLEGYYQETGRAGRDGLESQCITFYSEKDIQKLEKFMQGKPVAEREIGKLLLMETQSYAESAMCRRRSLMHYFGEEYPHENCGHCDNCCHPKKMVEASEDLKLVLEALQMLSDKFKPDHLVALLMGRETAAIKSYGHDQSEFFGAGNNREKRFWDAVIRQGIEMGLIRKNIENYGLVSITTKGEEFIMRPHSVKLAEDRDYEKEEEEAAATAPQSTGAADETLFKMLKSLRADVARKNNLPAYVIFQDPSLEDMTIQYPVSIEELQRCSGVGAAKAQKFGQKFVELIAKYVEDYDIIRPQTMLVKSVAAKSTNKIFIIQSIDRHMDFEDIARAKNLSFQELLTEIEGIVSSGTKLDIRYFLEQYMDEDRIEDIFLYFKEDAQSDSLDEAIEELGADYTEEEIRLVRIKFLCEVGQ